MPSRSPSERVAAWAGLLLLVAAALLPTPRDMAYAQPRVIVVEGDFLGADGLPNQRKSQECFAKVVRLLKRARVPYVATRDSLVERDGLPAGAVAVLPYNRAMTDAEAASMDRFVEGGGKLVVFFTGHESVLRKVGVRRADLAPADGADPPSGLALTGGIPGAPAAVAWKIEHFVLAEPLPGSQPLAVWQTKSGARTAQPALLANGSGVYFAAEPTGMEEAGGAALLRALIGKLAPAMWQAMVPTDPAQLDPFGRFDSLAQLRATVERQAQTSDGYQPALELATEAQQRLEEAARALGEGQVERALELSDRAHATAERAFWASYPSVAGELRGVWMCNFAAPSWPQAARSLAEANINAIFPYMMSGGVAFYKSKVLPWHPTVKERGDHLAEAVAAAKAVGLPLHARMLNLSTLFATSETRQALGQSGRLMVTATGGSSDWLCPSHPANRQMQVASALEMAGYGVAGIQFDYLRYPGKDTCFCPRCRQEFQRACGITVASWPADVITGGYRGRFADWRREQVTSLAQEISRAVRQRHPRLLISAAVFLNWESHRETFGQDWVAWIDRGLVDFLCPMNYTASMERFELYVSRQERWIAGKLPWAAGLGVHADGCDYPGPELAVEQIRVAREHGARGFVIFNYSEALVRDYLPRLKQGVTSEPTVFDCPVGPRE